ncbi:sulfur carrier protein ThiS [Nesterenkonia xinjiangensis]|uniref:Sulfur carrier protein n=1 Tax=Nesterenkonia xinjiangensis TaxID=225327 RepID=A0A7Z0KAA3_9MICC|nr:sulfur carrier protein ThiS [Nesterenkonia xinjiangensis]NYJ78080.1 sulfur carrier protein [Nesterenkonia xinjiangensis]
MLTVTINEEDVKLPEGATVVDAVAQTTGRELSPDGTPADGGRLGVAVAINAAVVPRSAWAATVLSHGEEIEIVTAVQGG